MSMKILVFLLLGINCCTLGCLKTSCPPLESTSCKCPIYTHPSIYCFQIEELEKLRRIFRRLKGYAINSLELFHVNTSAPMDLFNDLHITELRLVGFELKDSSLNDFDGPLHLEGLEESLRMLTIESSFRIYKRLKYLKLDHMKFLNAVLVKDNYIHYVGNDWFTDGPKRLKTLFFINNRIEMLGDKAFESLEGLNYLAVTGNRITKISRSMLPSKAHNLKKLDFDNNQIAILPSDIFSNMTSLAEVNMADNLILALKPDTWNAVLLQLRSLNVEGNHRLMCDDELKWVCMSKSGVIYGHCTSPEDHKITSISHFCKASS